MYILNYKLEIFPPIIPNNFILFRYNRVVNFHDSNVIADFDTNKTHSWNVDELFDLIIRTIKSLYLLDIEILNDFRDCCRKGDDYTFKKIKSSVIRNHMKKTPLWALNQDGIVEIPKILDKRISKINFKSKEEYIATLIEISHAIRVFLLENAERFG